jgi:hypothetical protein
MEVSSRHYDLNFFEQSLFNGIQYQLSPEVLQMIQLLETEIQIPLDVPVEQQHTYVKKYEDRRGSSNGGGGEGGYNGDRRRNNMSSSSSSSSKPARYNDRFSNHKKNFSKSYTTHEEHDPMAKTFKATKFDSKEGIEKKLSEIRAMINKISSKNYDTQKVEIVRLVKELMEANDAKKENSVVLSNVMFEIASTNKFFSEIYAELYKELIREFGEFDELLRTYLSSFKSTIDDIHYVDPDVDYDGYCKYTKTNDQRKAITVFLTFLLKKEVLLPEELLDLLEFFLTKTKTYIDEKDRTKDVEEITENVFLILSNGFSLFKENAQWQNELFPKIMEISKMKQKEHSSLASRVVFKYMDIIDKICCPKK